MTPEFKKGGPPRPAGEESCARGGDYTAKADGTRKWTTCSKNAFIKLERKVLLFSNVPGRATVRKHFSNISKLRESVGLNLQLKFFGGPSESAFEAESEEKPRSVAQRSGVGPSEEFSQVFCAASRALTATTSAHAALRTHVAEHESGQTDGPQHGNRDTPMYALGLATDSARVANVAFCA